MLILQRFPNFRVSTLETQEPILNDGFLITKRILLHEGVRISLRFSVLCLFRSFSY